MLRSFNLEPSATASGEAAQNVLLASRVPFVDQSLTRVVALRRCQRIWAEQWNISGPRKITLIESLDEACQIPNRRRTADDWAAGRRTNRAVDVAGRTIRDADRYSGGRRSGGHRRVFGRPRGEARSAGRSQF